MLLALAPAASMSAVVGGGMPDRSWLGVKRIGVAVELRGAAEPAKLARELCDRIVALASDRAPYPIACASPDAVAAAKLDTAILDIQAAVAPQPGGAPMLTFTVRRTMEAGLEPAPIRIGTAPRSVPLDPAARGGAALDAALASALAEVLPWRRPQMNSGLLPEPNGEN